MKQLLRNLNVTEKRVLLRLDLNVPIKNGIILDATKIINSIETINYLITHNAKIIILSHLGKVKEESDKENNTLYPIASALEKILNKPIYFEKDVLDPKLIERTKELKQGDIMLLENTRFMDLKGNLESNCDFEFSRLLASLGDIFCLDAFASSHRKHASTVGITKFLPSCIGLSLEKEITNLNSLIISPKRPFTVIMGGSKVEDKLLLIEKIIPKCDYLLLSGGLANSFLKALNFNIGESLCTRNPVIIKKLKEIMLKFKEKIMLPLDAIVGSTYDENYTKYKKINEIGDNEIIFDVGVKTIEKYKKVLINSKTIFMNGTMGVYENKKYSNGTKEILEVMKVSNAMKIAGGGDSVSAIKNFKYEESFTYLSTGGGATLKYLTDGHLIAIDNIMESDEIEVLDV